MIDKAHFHSIRWETSNMASFRTDNDDDNNNVGSTSDSLDSAHPLTGVNYPGKNGEYV
jgi:hypothetical protein